MSTAWKPTGLNRDAWEEPNVEILGADYNTLATEYPGTYPAEGAAVQADPDEQIPWDQSRNTDYEETNLNASEPDEPGESPRSSPNTQPAHNVYHGATPPNRIREPSPAPAPMPTSNQPRQPPMTNRNTFSGTSNWNNPAPAPGPQEARGPPIRNTYPGQELYRAPGISVNAYENGPQGGGGAIVTQRPGNADPATLPTQPIWPVGGAASGQPLPGTVENGVRFFHDDYERLVAMCSLNSAPINETHGRRFRQPITHPGPGPDRWRGDNMAMANTEIRYPGVNGGPNTTVVTDQYGRRQVYHTL